MVGGGGGAFGPGGDVPPFADFGEAGPGFPGAYSPSYILGTSPFMNCFAAGGSGATATVPFQGGGSGARVDGTSANAGVFGGTGASNSTSGSCFFGGGTGAARFTSGTGGAGWVWISWVQS
jgi:hypothetical protein